MPLSRSIFLAGVALALAALAPTGATAAAPTARAARTPARSGVAAGDCAGCHGRTAVLPPAHVATRNVKLARCLECHAPRTEKALTGKIPTSHLHRLAGVDCADCHGTGRAKKAVAAARCVECHGPVTELVTATASVKPENPHDSPHWGPGMECSACHRQHAKTVNWCAHCHDFPFRVP